MKNKIKFLIFCGIVLGFICGCNNEKIAYINPSKEVIEKIMNEEEYIIIDVRTKEEYENEHLIDAVNIPYDEIDENIEIEKEKVIFVYCQSGRRSQIAFNTLRDLGYTTYDLGAFANIFLPKE